MTDKEVKAQAEKDLNNYNCEFQIMKRQCNVELIKFDELNTNGRMYTKDSFESIPSTVPIYSDEQSAMDNYTKNIVGNAENIRIENNKLMCDASVNKDILGYYQELSAKVSS